MYEEKEGVCRSASYEVGKNNGPNYWCPIPTQQLVSLSDRAFIGFGHGNFIHRKQEPDRVTKTITSRQVARLGGSGRATYT